jgi:protein PET100, fungi type
MFPIGFMYYFGTNLDSRFAVPDFWPKPEATYRIPFEREEIEAELEHQRKKRLMRRKERMELETTEGYLYGAQGQRSEALPWWWPGDMRRRLEAERRREGDGRRQR